MPAPKSRQFDNADEENAAALADFQRDSVKDYGRTHGGSVVKNSYTESGVDHKFVSEVIPKHHTSDTFHPKCAECKADSKKGIHPSA